MNDREKLIELICESINDECSVHCNLSSPTKCFQCTCIANHLIANSVTIQKHERWEPVSLDDQYEGIFKCPGCKTERYFGAGYPSYYDGSYCPNCGAKMDMEE